MRDYHVTGTWGTPRERETPHTARVLVKKHGRDALLLGTRYNQGRSCAIYLYGGEPEVGVTRYCVTYCDHGETPFSVDYFTRGDVDWDTATWTAGGRFAH